MNSQNNQDDIDYANKIYRGRYIADNYKKLSNANIPNNDIEYYLKEINIDDEELKILIKELNKILN